MKHSLTKIGTENNLIVSHCAMTIKLLLMFNVVKESLLICKWMWVILTLSVIHSCFV